MKILFKLLLGAAIVCGATGINTYAADVRIVAKPQSKAFPIVGKEGNVAPFVFDPADAEVVAAVAEAVAGDIALITGKTPRLLNSLSDVEFPIIAGTIGQSSFIDRLAREGKIDVSGVEGKWEAYGLAVVENPCDGVKRALVAFGSNPRATAYSLFEISKIMGVSPYVWWADVTPEKRDMLYATPGSTTVGEPSVKFRGIFINDEDWGLTPWAAANIDSKYGNIGPNTYAKVMELLLRLRANVLWPAMHLCSQAFWDNKDNLPVAKKYDIALGSSHCEQMLRDNEWEWRRYEDKTGTYDNWNYVDNKDKIQRYWEERVKESKGFSAMYTLGMRGVHDWGISGYPSTEDKVRGLTEIIDFQRSLLKKHIGDPQEVPQIFIPYKEVLDAYNAGLQVPEDVILTWVDDNHGYVRQLPTTEEQKRSGGHGVYYHLSYWGTPADYLWLCSTSPSLISYELVKGYENGIKDLWVINVGDIKPAEAELEFCMDLAWDVDAWQPGNAHQYTRHWLQKTFGDGVADELAEVKREYYELGAAGKPEHIFGVEFPDAEMDERIERYAKLAAKTDKIREKIPAHLQDAYFELIEYPVKGAYNMNVMTFRAKQSLALAKQGKGEKALAYSADAERAHDEIGRLTEKYNTGIAGGKWNGMMDCKPRRQRQFDLPERATADAIAKSHSSLPATNAVRIPASRYSHSAGAISEMPGLGIGPGSVAVWPMDYTDYGDGKIADAPFVEYTVPVRKGHNRIEVRCLPSFPVHSGENLNVALSINGKEPEVCSLKTVATEGKWHHTVLQGYNDATVYHDSPADENVSLRVSLLNPGIAVSQIYTVAETNTPETADPITGELLLADPTIIPFKGRYYMAGTQPGTPLGFTVYVSDDLMHWQPTTDGAPQLTPGNSVFGTKGFWAPQFLPDGDKVYLFYTANEQVVAAKADSITGTYTSCSAQPSPIDPSCGNIDPFLFRDSDGTCYLYHVRFDNGNWLWVGEYDLENGKIVDGTLQPTFRVTQPWEHTRSYESVPIMEGPTVVKMDGTYYLFYSANHFMSKDYAVGYATAPTPYGPWTKNPDNPVISREIIGESGTGHGDIFTDRKGGLRYVFHTHNSNDKVSPRRTRIVNLKSIPSEEPGMPARIVAEPSTLIKPVLAEAGEVYLNPVINSSAPDPTVIRHSDGTYYLYATENVRNLPIYKSNNLVDWEFVATAFTDESRPQMVPDGAIWAPDIQYIDGRYVLYYSKSRWGGEWECGIGVATSDSPEGPFTDHGPLFISNEIGVQNSIDPFYISEKGKHYLFWGSFRGIYGIELSKDALSVKKGAKPVQIAGTLTEGTNIFKHDGWYYLVGSAGSCCEGERSTYRVVMARSKKLFGPYVDKEGKPALDNGFSLLMSRSKDVIGPGHNANFVTDDAGQHWMLYHGFDAAEPDAGRKVYLDRITWDADGWPMVETHEPSASAPRPVINR